MKRYLINKSIRTLLGLSGRQLAERVEVTKQTISHYEAGRPVNRPTERVIEIELDLAIEQCVNVELKKICEQLKTQRTGIDA